MDSRYIVHVNFKLHVRSTLAQLNKYVVMYGDDIIWLLTLNRDA